MLQQILKEMWVDPEILAELDEGQKQTLFCKMREEQVRRWRVWDEKLNNQELLIQKPNNKKPKKNVSFLMGIDNEPWTWVMGEHPDDKKIEEILEEEARELARQQAEKEAEELRKTVEKQLTDFIELPKIDHVPTYIDDSMDIYCSVDELREKIQNNKISNNKPLKNTLNNFTFHTMNNNNANNNRTSNNVMKYNTINNFVSSNDKRDALQELSLNKPVKVAQKVALWEKRLMEERTSEIFKRIQKKQLEAAKEAEEFERIQEQLWKEQERKAKEAEQQIREIARRAREEHRRTTNQDLLSTNSQTSSSTTLTTSASPTVTSSTITTHNSNNNGDSEAYSDVIPLPGARPPSKQAVVEWYRASEVPRRAGIDDKDQPSPWFHGLIDRHEAETLLHDQPEGTFLVRVSERIWGYAISYRASDRCKHYLVDASSGHYQFLGANQISHDTLGDLINYHGLNPITVLGNERLLHSCPKTSEPAILNGIIGPCR